MNNPYLYPDQCEWTEDHHELRHIRKVRYIQQNTNAERYDFEDDRDGLVFWHV